jgi:hypothetical protein
LAVRKRPPGLNPVRIESFRSVLVAFCKSDFI